MKKSSGFALIVILIALAVLTITAGGVVVWKEKISPKPLRFLPPMLTPTQSFLQTPTSIAKSCVPRQGPCEKGDGVEKFWYYSEKDNLCQQFSTYIRCQGSAFTTEEACKHACVVAIPQRTEMKQGLYGKVYAKNCMPIGPHPKGPWHGKTTFSRVENEEVVETIETMVEEGNYKIGLTEGVYRVNSSQGTIFPRQVEVQQNQWREQDFDICTSF